MIDEERQLNFIHIPKTGGTYIEVYMASHIYDDFDLNVWDRFVNNHLPHPVDWKAHVKKVTGLNDYPDTNPYYNPIHVRAKFLPKYAHSFCIIRDPLELRKSAYRHLCSHWNYSKSFNFYVKSGDFKIWPMDTNCGTSTFGFRQSDYIYDDDGHFLVDKIFLFTEIDSCLDYIDEIYRQKRPRHNKRSRKFFWNRAYPDHASFARKIHLSLLNIFKKEIYVDTESTDIIKDYYKKDYELWLNKQNLQKEFS